MNVKHLGISLLGISTLLTPLVSLAAEHGKSAEAHSHGQSPKTTCATVPPGHLIAKGWLKKHALPTLAPCQTLPKGISKEQHKGELNDNDWGEHGRHASTTPDIVAPVISSLSVTALASTSATVAWNTNEFATSRVYFGTSSPLVLTTAAQVGTTTLSLAHSVTLTGLTASTTYNYVIESKDASGNVTDSLQQSLTTTN